MRVNAVQLQNRRRIQYIAKSQGCRRERIGTSLAAEPGASRAREMRRTARPESSAARLPILRCITRLSAARAVDLHCSLQTLNTEARAEACRTGNAEQPWREKLGNSHCQRRSPLLYAPGPDHLFRARSSLGLSPAKCALPIGVSA